MRHLDLFSGIGGFALAVDSVWPQAEHTFVEIELFCQMVLRKHWPYSKIYGDIKKFKGKAKSADLVTGGFPCQPFSIAGAKRGKSDNRYLWPEMLRVISEVQPNWVVGENVANLWNMEFEQMLSDLENQGYEVETFIIPACAVNAPHRRDRIWIVAYPLSNSTNRKKIGGKLSEETREQKQDGTSNSSTRKSLRTDSIRRSKRLEKVGIMARGTEIYPDSQCQRWGKRYQPQKRQIARHDKNVENSPSQRCSGRLESSRQILELQSSQDKNERPDWSSNWLEVATRFCRVDDGIPNRVDRIKSLGNAIVPQVATEIFKAIKKAEEVLTL